MFNTVLNYIPLVAQVLLLLALSGYIFVGLVDMYLRILDPGFHVAFDREAESKFAHQYFKRPIWNSYWVWALCKVFDFFIIGFVLSIGPIHGWWQVPMYVIGMVFMINLEITPRFQVWQHVND